MNVIGRVVLLLSSIWMSSATEVPSVTLNTGAKMPMLALGTYLGFDQNGIVKSENKMLRNAVMHAVDIGYRHFDTASVYQTEDELGEAVRMKIKDGVVNREDIFITTKLWNTHHKREQVAQALKESLERLGLNHVDLYLMHWPMAFNEDYTYANVDFMETWRGMEDMVRLGRTKAIGVSNFNKEQLERVLTEGSIKPAAIQIEIHPQIAQSELVAFAQSKGVVVMGYSPFGSMVMRNGLHLPGPKFDDSTLVEISESAGKTVPQVILRWLVDRNITPVVKSINPKRQEENINIFDFSLKEADIEKINQFDSTTRYTLPSFWQSHPHYPFEKIENALADPFKKTD